MLRGGPPWPVSELAGHSYRVLAKTPLPQENAAVPTPFSRKNTESQKEEMPRPRAQQQ